MIESYLDGNNQTKWIYDLFHDPSRFKKHWNSSLPFFFYESMKNVQCNFSDKILPCSNASIEDFDRGNRSEISSLQPISSSITNSETSSTDPDQASP